MNNFIGMIGELVSPEIGDVKLDEMAQLGRALVAIAEALKTVPPARRAAVFVAASALTWPTDSDCQPKDGGR